MFVTQGRASIYWFYVTGGHILQASFIDRAHNSLAFLLLVANDSIRLDGYQVLVPNNPQNQDNNCEFRQIVLYKHRP